MQFFLGVMLGFLLGQISTVFIMNIVYGLKFKYVWVGFIHAIALPWFFIKWLWNGCKGPILPDRTKP